MEARARSSGFTLIEMLVVVAVVAVFATLAGPSFSGALDRARLKSQTAGVIDVLEFAKSEGMKRLNVAVAITSGANWSIQATATDSDGNLQATKAASYDASNGSTLVTPSTSQTLATNFRGVVSGYVNSNITLQSRQGLQVRVMINPIGHITVCSVGGTLTGYSAC